MSAKEKVRPDLISAARELLNRIEEVEETSVNAQAQKDGENSYWVAGNITRSAVEDLKSALASAVRDSHCS